MGENVSNGEIDSKENGTNFPSPGSNLQPIAIVGMATRLPGGVASPEELWNFLIEKKDGRSVVPRDRYNIEGFYKDRDMPDSVNIRHGYFLQQDLGHWDAGFFSANKAEAASMDLQQRLLLEVVWECLESGGQTQWHGKDIGCFVGSFGEDWLGMMSRDNEDHNPYRMGGAGDWALANRVSYEFDFKGPSMTVRTACSSGLLALHEACQAINNGECSAAIVGGTSLIMNPKMTIDMSMIGMLAPDGICKTLDESANGFARGEAISAILNKRLDLALKDNDPIRAVIRATSSNHDGKGPGLLHPTVTGQEAMIRQAYQAAGISDLSETCFIECHGTGTAVGDPVETTAIANVFGGEQDIFIGSVKPNFGHSEGASGITNTIAAVLALEHRTIPPNIHFKKPNPQIPFEEGRLKVALEPTPWPAGRAERVSVSSFGVGGSNVHLILESAASLPQILNSQTLATAVDQAKLLLFSANTADSLTRRADQIREYYEARPDRIHDLAYTLGQHREHLSLAWPVKTDRLKYSQSRPIKPPRQRLQ